MYKTRATPQTQGEFRSIYGAQCVENDYHARYLRHQYLPRVKYDHLATHLWRLTQTPFTWHEYIILGLYVPSKGQIRL